MRDRTIHTKADTLGRACLLGLATGIRSTAGFGILAISGSADRDPFVRPAGLRRAIGGSVLVEAVVDKIGVLPPRTDPVPLAGRALLGGAAAALAASRFGSSRLVAAFAGALSATAAAFAATRVRAAARRRGTPDLLPAVAEDAVVGSLAAAVRAGL